MKKIPKYMAALILLTISISCLTPLASAASVSLTGIYDGQVFPSGDISFGWTPVAEAEYYTVAIRYIEHGENGPLAADSIITRNDRYTLSSEIIAGLGYGKYRICISAVIGEKRLFSPVINFFVKQQTPLSSKKLVAFGDSLTANGVWAKLLSARFCTNVINCGLGGSTSESSRERFITDVISRSPDIVFICFAYNDAVKGDFVSSRVSLERYTENLRFFAEEAKKAGAEVIFFSPNTVVEEAFNANPWHPGENYIECGGFPALLERYISAMKSVSAEYGTGFVDLYARFAELNDPTLIEKAGVHPLDAGYAIYAELLGDYLEQKYCTIYGDVDGNGTVDARDYILLRAYMLGLCSLDRDSLSRADADRSQTVNIKDYIHIRRLILFK